MINNNLTIKLGEASLKIGSGATPKGGKKAYLGGHISLIRSLNVYDEGFSFNGLAKINDQQAALLKNVTIQENDVLFNITGASIARCCVVPKEVLPARVNQHVSIIRTNKLILDPHYLHYYLIHPSVKSKLISASGGSSREAITKEQLGNLVLNIPNIFTQCSISKILSSIEEKIKINNKINEELEAMAKLIYNYWFIQFDFPDEHGKPYKSSGGKMLRIKDFEREVPEGWRSYRLINLINESKNGDWGKKEAAQGYHRAYCIRGADINGLNGKSIFNPPIRYISNTNSERFLKPDDLIVEISGGSPTQSTGRIAHISQDVLTRLEDKAVCSNFCKAISLKDRKLSYIINYYWNHLYDSRVFFNFEGKTSGIKNLLFDQIIKDLKIVLPNDNNLIYKYYNLIDDINSQKQNNLLQNKTLSVLRDWLLPMLISGQVKVT